MKAALLFTWRSRYGKLLMLPAMLFIAGWAYLGVLQLTGNFHEVVPGELYRSAQVTDARVVKYASKHHIASIINLRGENAGRAWYDEEVKAAHDNHIAHYNFRMSSKHALTPEQSADLIALMRNAPKPLLIHCQAGADRSGLAAALYLAAKGHDEATAEKQLSPRYGHISISVIGAPEMDATFEAMETALGYKNS